MSVDEINIVGSPEVPQDETEGGEVGEERQQQHDDDGDSVNKVRNFSFVLQINHSQL